MPYSESSYQVFSSIMFSNFILYLMLYIFYIYFKLAVILTQSFRFNNLINLSPNLAYIQQASSLKHCTNSFYL